MNLLKHALAHRLQCPEDDLQVSLALLLKDGLELRDDEALRCGRLAKLLRDSVWSVKGAWEQLATQQVLSSKPSGPGSSCWRWSWAFGVEVEALELGLCKEETWVE